MATNKVYSTNYFNTLICIADDCPEKQGAIPPLNDKAKTYPKRITKRKNNSLRV
jgi:hypothetical protein